MAIRLTSPLRRTPSEDTLPPPGAYTKSTRLTKLRTHISASPAGKMFTATVLVWIVAAVICRYAFWRDPHSWFFDGDSAYKFEYTELRRQEAREFITAANDSSNDLELLKPHSSNKPVICLALATVRREGVQYLNDTVGSILTGLTDEERSAINVRVVFANATDDPPQAPHPDFGQEGLSVVDAWGSYNISDEELEVVREYVRRKQMRKKWIFDYTYALDQCYNKTTAPYIAVVEDDVIFADDWLPKTLDAISKIREKSTIWLYLRLFYTEAQLGWDKAVDNWYQNPVFSFFLAMTLCFTFSLAVRILSRRWSTSMSDRTKRSLAVATWITIPAFTILFFMIGLESLKSLSPWHFGTGIQRMDTKGCCNQALIYPRHQVPLVSEMLRSTKAAPTDWMIEDWANEQNLARFAVSPPVVQHVGLVSSRNMPVKYARETFAYSFEGQDRKTLRREHHRMSRAGICRAEDDLPVVEPS